MTDEEFQRITGFIKSAVDTAGERFEKRFGKPIMARLDQVEEKIDKTEKRLTTEINYVKDRVSSLERTMKDNFKKFEAMERGDVGAVIQDTDRLKRIVEKHDKRITALEKTATR